MFNQQIFLLLLLPVLNAVDLDYYFNVPNPLRSKGHDCSKRFYQEYCQLKCGEEIGVCWSHRCYCLSITSSDVNGAKFVKLHLENQDQSEYDSDENEEDTIFFENHPDSQDQSKRDAGETEEVNELIQRNDEELKQLNSPVLRHHIAHFCPNLDVARDCIKKCMKEGKPAFCGKDHVCYCGHTYSHHDKNDPADAKETYSEFKDLYEKYFGTKSALKKHK